MSVSSRVPLCLSMLVLGACTSAAPEIKTVVAARPSDPSKALLDLRGLRGVQAYKDGVLVDGSIALAPGMHQLHFAFDAVVAQKGRCAPKKGGGDPTVLLNPMAWVVLPVVLAVVGGVVVTCRVVSGAKASPRACYATTLNARPGHAYAPRAAGEKPVLIDTATGRTVSTTRDAPCPELDRLAEQARERQLRETAARKQQHEKKIAKEAKRGDPRAMYRMYEKAPNRDAKLYWLCRAAHRGHVEARFRFAAFFHHDGQGYRRYEDAIRNDPAEAWIWYRLTVKAARALHGQQAQHFYLSNAQEMSGALTRRLTAAHMARGQRRLNRFRPRPSTCRKTRWPMVKTPAGWTPVVVRRKSPAVTRKAPHVRAPDNSLKERFSGKTWSMSYAFGLNETVNWRIELQKGGRLVGYRKRMLRLGYEVGSDRDAGRWWTDADRLCMKWSSWGQGQSLCYRITCTEFNCVAAGPKPFSGKFLLN